MASMLQLSSASAHSSTSREKGRGGGGGGGGLKEAGAVFMPVSHFTDFLKVRFCMSMNMNRVEDKFG